MSSSKPADQLAKKIELAQLPPPVRELRFAKSLGRQHRFDFAWEDRMLAAEVDGGIYIQGRHTRGSGYEEDCVKFNLAARLGWRVLHFTPRMVRSGEAIETLSHLLN